MATTFFLTSTASTATLPAAYTGTKKVLSLSRGGGVVTQTDNTIASISANASNAQGWGAATSGADPKNGLIWVTDPLAGAVLTTASVWVFNLRALESANTANYSCGGELYHISADGSTSTQMISAFSSTELGTSEVVRSINATILSTTLSDGDRIVFVPVWVAAGGTSASGKTVSGFYNGTASLASGDTFVTAPDTLTLFTATVAPPRPTIISQAVNRSAVW